MNKAIITGNLAADPTSGQSRNDKTWCRFTVAVQRRYAGEDGERKADFLPVVTWGKTAENCARYLSKGRKVCVDGRIETRSYDGEDDRRHYVTEIVADNVEFLPSRSSGEASTGEFEE